MTPEQLAALVADKEAGTPGPWAVLTPILWIMAGQMQVADTRGWGYLTAPVNSNPDLGGLGLSKDAAIAIQEANARRIARVPDLEDAVIALTSEVAHLTAEVDETNLKWDKTSVLLGHKNAEVARLSNPPDDAEAAALVKALRDTADHAVFAPSLHHIAADALTRLSHALAAETASREAMRRAMSEAHAHIYSGHGKLASEVLRATLAKHGSK